MARNDTTSAIIDGLLKVLVSGVALSTLILAPNAIQVFDKPLSKFLSKMDKRSRQRELRRTLTYMKAQGLISSNSDDYEHGIIVTRKGRKRSKEAAFDSLTIPSPKLWDKKWRLVFFDIPERSRSGRNALTRKLRKLGFQQLQQSAWIHPFPCRNEVEVVASTYKLQRYVSYIETNYIDNQTQLKKGFNLH